MTASRRGGHGGATTARPAARRTARPDRSRPPGRPPGAARPARVRYYRRRRLAAVLAALLLVVGLAAGTRLVLHDLGLFDVEGVEVTGLSGVPEEAVLAAAAVVPGEPLVAVDTDAVARRVAEVPGVASAQVGRGWPHTVSVEVTERVAVANVQGPALVDAAGFVYRGPAVAGLPRLVVATPGPDDPATQAALAVLTSLRPDLRGQVVAVGAAVAVPGAPAQVSLDLTDGRQVRWGDRDDAARKAAVLVPLLTQPGRVFDVTSPDLPTVTR